MISTGKNKVYINNYQNKKYSNEIYYQKVIIILFWKYRV